MSPEYKGRIIIELKKDINDPAGNAIAGGLRQLGFEVGRVRLSKYREMIVEAPNIKLAWEIVEAAARHEASPVMENYHSEVSRTKRSKQP